MPLVDANSTELKDPRDPTSYYDMPDVGSMPLATQADMPQQAARFDPTPAAVAVVLAIILIGLILWQKRRTRTAIVQDGRRMNRKSRASAWMFGGVALMAASLLLSDGQYSDGLFDLIMTGDLAVPDIPVRFPFLAGTLAALFGAYLHFAPKTPEPD